MSQVLIISSLTLAWSSKEILNPIPSALNIKSPLSLQIPFWEFPDNSMKYLFPLYFCMSVILTSHTATSWGEFIPFATKVYNFFLNLSIKALLSASESDEGTS